MACASVPVGPAAASPTTTYDPLRLGPPATTVELVARDAARGRELPLEVYLPAAVTPAPVILFSHGLGGSRDASPFLGHHWASRGYVAVFLQHPGSDRDLVRDAAPGERLDALRGGASLEAFLDRVRDVPATLDQLERWHRQPGHPLAGRLDLSRTGMAGHSFGAITTQAVSGQSLPARGPVFTDPRIRAALVLSPSAPRRGDPRAAFASVAIPWMLMTGTRDTAPIGEKTVESRLAVFPALPPGDKYELVLDGGQHSAFTDRALPGDRARNPNHHRLIVALSTAFFDAVLRRDPDAHAWLAGPGPRSLMEPGDRWQRK